jgi:2-dehydropantoate 2-reductase
MSVRADRADRRRSYAVIGTGAIGGFYGAKLAAAGHDVHFIARSDLDHLRRNGLRVESPDGAIELSDVSAHAGAETVPAVDTVLVAVKTTDTVAVLPLVRDLAAHGATVVVMQNGLGVEALVADAVPDATVIGAMCFICSNKAGPGVVRHLDFGRVTAGELGANGATPAVKGLVDDLAGAGVAASALDDLALGRWKKLVWNIPYNGLSVVLDAGTDELMADPHTRALVEDLMREVLAGAVACGRTIPGDFVQQMLDDTERMIPYATSMKLDHDAGRPLELQAIYGEPLARAREAGCEMVRVQALYDQLSFLDARARRR